MQPNFPQPFLVCQMLQSLNGHPDPSLALLQDIHVLPILVSPELYTALQVRPHQH